MGYSLYWELICCEGDGEYIAPLIQDGVKVVQLQKEEVEVENDKWRKAIIMYIVGASPTICALERLIVAQ